MKNFLIVTMLLFSSSAFAACLIDEGACSIAEFQKPMDMTYTTRDGIKEYSATPEARLKPSRNEAGEKMLRTFGPKNQDFGYNADCQFGVCYDKGESLLFKQDR